MNEHSASRIARENFDKTLETGAETVRGVQEGFTSDFFGLGAPNAAFDFASEVAEAKAASDLVQAWTTHATKQVEMLTKQASDLTTLGQQFARTSSEAVTRRVAQGSKR